MRLPPSKYTYLPNTAGCYTADDAVRTLRLARELLDGHELVKLEVLGDPKSLFPNMMETLKAAETLVKDGFKVMVYCSDDPILAKRLEEIGCVAVMPLASLIGSGMGILNPWNLQLILENAKVPVIVDAGVGTASDAAIAMELGCDGVLMNTAVAAAKNPVLMAQAMKKAVEAGREAYLAGRMPKKLYAAAPELAHHRHHRQGRLRAGRARTGAVRRPIRCPDPPIRRYAASCCARAACPTRSGARSIPCCRSTALPTRRARSRSSRYSAGARRRSSRSASAWARPPR